MRRFNITVNGKVYDVAVEEVAAGAAPAAPAEPQAPVEGTDVVAPMPGTIMEINCAVGDKVTRGQAVLVLEAMKMNNDIVAPCDGTILQIIAQKGDSVNSGDVLAVIG